MTTPIDPSMPYSVVMVPKEGKQVLEIPDGMYTLPVGHARRNVAISLKRGVSQVQVSWNGAEELLVQFVVGAIFERVARIPAGVDGTERTATFRVGYETDHQIDARLTTAPAVGSPTLTKGRRALVTVVPMEVPGAGG